MIDSPDISSSRPYLIRAIYEWCADNGFTPYLAVSVNKNVQVPHEYVKDGEIVLNISMGATSDLKLGNDFIEFKGRFAGKARDIMVPVNHVIAIYARENGQGMTFPFGVPKADKSLPSLNRSMSSMGSAPQVVSTEVKPVQLTSVSSKLQDDDHGDDPKPPRNLVTALRPTLKRVK